MGKFIKRCFIFLFFISLISIVCSILYIKLSPSLNINSTNSIQLIDGDGSVFFKGNESKEWINLDNISDYLINATISTEDKNFFKHFGFDLLRILKASYINIINRETIQGASTISQQYAKNLFLDFDKTWKRK
jgi:membrane peptidoglycan carboxypeptidase